MKTSDYRIPWPDLRRRRADMLTAMVMNEIQPFICSHEEVDLRKHACRKLFELFHTIGVEVITDFERTAAGLPLRNPEGYTADELHRLEAVRAAARLGPMPPFPLRDLQEGKGKP